MRSDSFNTSLRQPSFSTELQHKKSGKNVYTALVIFVLMYSPLLLAASDPSNTASVETREECWREKDQRSHYADVIRGVDGVHIFTKQQMFSAKGATAASR